MIYQQIFICQGRILKQLDAFCTETFSF